MLASVAMEPMEFAFPRRPVAPAMPTASELVDPERQALIAEIESVEGAALGRAPLLFRLVLLCGGAICAGAGGGLVLGVADLVRRII
jgi:hypothetical protein